MKLCKRCGETKAVSEFKTDRSKPSGRGSTCKACNLAQALEWERKNPARAKAKWARASSLRRTTNRAKVLMAYGSRCVCCGESEPMFLTIDHINNDGATHRRELGIRSGDKFYAWIIKNNFPSNLQILCFNCNCAKGVYGKCPHKKG